MMDLTDVGSSLAMALTGAFLVAIFALGSRMNKRRHSVGTEEAVAIQITEANCTDKELLPIPTSEDCKVSLFDAPQLPLAGIRVVDFGQYMAGPLAASLLADAGATVMRIDPPEGPRWKSPAMAGLTKGKRVICLDLKTASGLAEARKLVLNADVVIENFRPGVMQRLGLGAQACCKENPKLIYLALPGFASTDSKRAGIQAWEGVVLATAGVLHAMGPNRVLMGKMPSYTPIPLASTFGGIIGAAAVTAALHSRELTGLGDIVEVPLASALLECLIHNTIKVDNMPARYIDPREKIIEERLASGEAMNMAYDELKDILDVFYCHYWCSDGLPLYVVAVNHSTHQERVLKALGLWDELLLAGLPVGQPGDAYRKGCDRLNGAGAEWVLGMTPLFGPWEGILREKMRAAFRERPAAEWERILADAGVPVAAHRTSLDWFRSAHVREAGLAVEVHDKEHGPMLLPGPVAWLTESIPTPSLHKSASQCLLPVQESQPRRSHLRTVSQQSSPSQASTCDTESSLRDVEGGESSGDLEAGAAETSIPRAMGWLQGVRILDFCNVIAGPSVAMMMERFGADVIKVDAAQTRFDPYTTVLYGLSHHRGKRSTLVDMSTASGRSVVHDLIASWKPDVITINSPERQLAPLGLAEGTLRALVPEVVILRLDAWGGPVEGGGDRCHDVGYDDVVQAAQGMQERFGGGFDTVEEHAHVGTIDVITGWSGVFAVMQALFHARRLKQFPNSDIAPKLNARTSLAAVGHYVQLPFMYDCYDRERHPQEPRGPDALGESSLVRCYQVADGWLFVQASAQEELQQGLFDGPAAELDHTFVSPLSPVTKCRHGPDFRRQSSLMYEDEMAESYGGIFRQRGTAFWLEALEKVGVAAAPIVPMSAVRIDASLVSGGQAFGADTFLFESHPEHPAGRLVEYFAPCAIRTARSPIIAPKPAVQYGTHTVSVMRDVIGYSEDQIQRLIVSKAVAEQLGEEYLPSD